MINVTFAQRVKLQEKGRRWGSLFFVGLLLLSGCSANPPGEAETLTIFAAASLTQAFTAVAAAFEAEEPGVNVRLNFAGSQQLARQLAQGAPADLFASADEQQMEVAVASGRVVTGTPRRFAGNLMTIITPTDNPAAIGGLADLAHPGVKVVLAGESVPAGRYARQVLERAAADPSFAPRFPEEVLANVVSHEQNVRAVLTKVELGEADAGLVYTSDVGEADVKTITIPNGLNVRASYLLAPVADSTGPELARAFIDFALSSQGQQILVQHGLQPIREQ